MKPTGLVKWAWQIHVHGPIKGKHSSCKSSLQINATNNLGGISMEIESKHKEDSELYAC